MRMQVKDGGWGFDRPAQSYGGMTVAGLCGTIICDYYLKEDYKNDPAVKKGLAWIDKNFTVRQNPGSITSSFGKCGPNVWYSYYLYDIERLGVIGGWDSFGGVEWYPAVARRLLTLQNEDGYWDYWPLQKSTDPDKKASAEYAWGHPVLDTCLALLCLKKATIALPVPIIPSFEESEEQIQEEIKDK